MRRLLALATLAACGGSTAPVPPGIRVEVEGSLRDVMHGGSTEGRIALAEVVRPGAIAVGALEGLRGEVTVLDGKMTASVVTEGAIVTSEAAGALRATMLVHARVDDWREIPIRGPIGAGRLDQEIERALVAGGVALDAPVPIVIDGSFSSLTWHVIDGGHGSSTTMTRSTPGPALLVGFFSRHHEGVFTHAGQRTHLHALTSEATGHVDEAAVAGAATLRVPR